MFLLDTNILSELIKKRPNPHLIKRLQSHPPDSFFTSSICVMELRMGSALREDFASFWEKIGDRILSRVSILAFGSKEALAAGDILAQLRKTGQPIGIEDVLIGASAIVHHLVVVTANESHFRRINGLRVENWLKEPLLIGSGPV